MGGRLIGGNSTSVATWARRGGEMGEERGLTGGTWLSAAEACTRGWAGFARWSGPGLVQSWAGAEKTAHDPFPFFKFLF
jgi:hypothetical protein